MVLIDYKNIGDSLTTDEFNAIVSLLKHNKTLSDELEIKNGAVTGEYGTYTFDLESTTIVDNGVLITDETLTSLGTVTLSNPVFNNTTYKLHLTVISMEEPNILDDNKSETTTTDLTITLQKGTAVQIPFQTLTNYCIILFNATISIKQDQPVITGKYITGLTLTSNKTLTHSYDPTTLIIKATDLDQIGVSGKTIKLYKDNTLLTTLTTDTNGEATYTYKGDPTGEHTFQAKHHEVESETVTVQYMPLWYDDAVTSPKTVNWYKSTQNYTETIDNTGTLWTVTDTTQFVANSTSTANYFLPNDEAWAVEMDIISYNDVTIRIRESASSFTPFTFSNRGVTANSHLKIVYNGDNTLTYTIDDNAPVTSNTIEFSSNIGIGVRLNSASATLKFKNFTIYNDATPTLELTATEDTISTGDTTTLTMTLLYGTTPLSGETVKLYQDGTLIDTLTTDNNGEATYTYTGTGAGDVSFQAEYGILLSETYTIEDCIYYNTNQTSATLNINLPSNFSISWKVHRTNGTLNDNGLSQPQLQDSTHNYYIGQFGSLGNWGFLIRNQGSSSNLVRKDGSPNIPNDTEKTILYTYNNGVHTCEVDGNSVTDTNSYAPTKLDNIIVGSMNVMQNLKIKPL